MYVCVRVCVPVGISTLTSAKPMIMLIVDEYMLCNSFEYLVMSMS